MMNDNLTQMSDPQLNSMTPGLIVYSSSRFCVTQIHVLLLNMAGHSRISEYMIIVAKVYMLYLLCRKYFFIPSHLPIVDNLLRAVQGVQQSGGLLRKPSSQYPPAIYWS